jgi:predicted RNase H-like HicB family nuclease
MKYYTYATCGDEWGYTARCVQHPHIVGRGETEEEAMLQCVELVKEYLDDIGNSISQPVFR